MVQGYYTYIIDLQLFKKDDKLLVAVSGGVDSVVLGQLLWEFGYDFAVAHCNFQLRGKESDGDEAFVKEMAERWNAPFYVKKFDTIKYASKQKISIQVAARELRYAWFEELRQSINYDYIVTAHHGNDNVETVFFNFARGTGLTGMTGMKPINNRIVRPLLWTTKERILEYQQEENLSFREDSSNESDKYSRNFIRHHIVPKFEKINPYFAYNAIDNIKRLAQAKELLDFSIQQIQKEVTEMVNNQLFINIDKLKAYPSVSMLLFELLKEFGFNSTHISNILREGENKIGSMFYTPTHKLLIDRAHYIVAPKIGQTDMQTEWTILKEEKSVECTHFYLNLEYLNEKPVFDTDVSSSPLAKMYPLESMSIKFPELLDADKLIYPLTVRKWRTGDRFQPLGMGGKSQLLSDFIRLQKLSAYKKEMVRVLETADKKICWVIDFRIDERFKITDDTKSFAQILCMTKY